MFVREVRYVKRTHPKKPRYWTDAKYWGRLNKHRNDKWVFGDKDTGMYLLKFSWFPIERHTLVKGDASKDDPYLKEYWAKRKTAKATDLTPSKRKIAEKQNGKCPICGESLFNGEEIHKHHADPKEEGGASHLGNFQCVPVLPSTNPQGTQLVNSHWSLEVSDLLEPCAGKLASTVLRGGGYSNVASLPAFCVTEQRNML